MKKNELKDFLDEMVIRFNQKAFIENDPISIPHKYTLKEDIEISGFLTSIIAWGKRPMIINNASRLMNLMDDSPYDFIINAGESELEQFNRFVHRTFNSVDAIYFIKALKQIYLFHDGLESVFAPLSHETSMKESISRFRELFLSFNSEKRTHKHIGDPMQNSACKRINMFLRWMIRNDRAKVDFGLWKKFHDPGLLLCPLDLHSGSVARQLGLLSRKQDDWKSTEELTARLKSMDPLDPVKYDFALFGLGVSKEINQRMA